MKKCVFILPYFGKFNDYFSLFLKSCGANLNYDWLIFTDDHRTFNYPENVKVIYISFSDFSGYFKQKIGSFVSLEKPYKLCDFKPTYGYVLSDYISEYDYWGHCDCDVLFGNLDKLLSPLLEDDYDKLFAAGHLTIYKNNVENNQRFMESFKGKPLYKEFLSTEDICWFDEDWKEENIHGIFLQLDAKVYSESMALNPSGKYTFFRQRVYDPTKRVYMDEAYKKALYVWTQSGVYRYIGVGKRLVKEEYLYVHLQHRKMEVVGNCTEADKLQILPTRFVVMGELPKDFNDLKKMNLEPLLEYRYAARRIFKSVERKMKRLRGAAK